MRTIYPAVILIMLAAAACSTLPPNGISHARFVRDGSEAPVSRVGFASGVMATDKTLAGPVADGTYVRRISDSYDASVVAHDGLAHYEGLVRPFENFGILHGAGIGVPSLSSEALGVAMAVSVGAWAQFGRSLFASMSYAPLLGLSNGDGELVHFFNAEVGFAFPGELQFAPTLVVSYLAFNDLPEGVLPIQGVLNLSVLLGQRAISSALHGHE